MPLFCFCWDMFVNGHNIYMGVGGANQHLWSDGKSQRALLYVTLKGKDCR